MFLNRFVSYAWLLPQAVGIIERAAQENAMIVFTLVDPQMVNTVMAACHFYNVR